MTSSPNFRVAALGSGLLSVVDPGGVAACSRWWSVVCDTTGYRLVLEMHPGGVQAPGTPAGVQFLESNDPVVSQTALHHRLQALIPPGSAPRQRPILKVANYSALLSLLLCLLLVLTACRIGPNYTRPPATAPAALDRKSTRLNSSH